MKKIIWNEVTPFSRFAALVVFLLLLPILTFYIGRQYELAQISIQDTESKDAASLKGAPVSGQPTSVVSGSKASQEKIEYMVADFNFDGFNDRAGMKESLCGATGNCPYFVELYNSSDKTYIPFGGDGVFSYGKGDVPAPEKPGFNIDDNHYSPMNPKVNAAEKIICEYSNSSANDYRLLIYKHRQNYFYPVKEVDVDFDNDTQKTLKKTYVFDKDARVLQSTVDVTNSQGSGSLCTLVE